MVLLDWINGLRGNISSLTEDSFDSALPSNVNDSDLGMHLTVTPRPDIEVTDVSYELVRWQMALNQFRVDRSLRTAGDQYRSLLEIDAELREFWKATPGSSDHPGRRAGDCFVFIGPSLLKA